MNHNAVETVLARMRGFDQAPAVYWRGQVLTYADFFRQIDAWRGELAARGIGAGSICGVHGDYSPHSCSLIFALLSVGAVIVPFTVASGPEMGRMEQLSSLEGMFSFADDDSWTFEARTTVDTNDLIEDFRTRGLPGLIVFTSGSTGAPKGILHDCERVMRKFVEERRGWRTILFLMMDHFGGFNTLVGTFAYGGMAVCSRSRTPEGICEAIQAAHAQLLPTTPTFLNLLMTSSTWQRFDLSSVELITYGTELMPQATLAKLGAIFPNTRFKQTYGLSELGVLRSHSQGSHSTWVKVGGDGFETKVLDGVLWIRSEASMVGYLNAPNPFESDGWFCTGDAVEQDGEFIRFVGRKSDVINVGGHKLLPIEVEEALLQADNVLEATVYAVDHPIMGQVPCARVTLREPEDAERLTARLRAHCRERLAKFKVPMRIVAVDALEQRTERHKKVRHAR